MKRVPLKDRGQMVARDVIVAMLEQPSGGTGITYAEMRKRGRVIDAVLAAPKDDWWVDLEDADYDVLRGILEGFQFATARRELRQILDDIAGAKSPEDTPSLKVVKDSA